MKIQTIVIIALSMIVVAIATVFSLIHGVDSFNVSFRLKREWLHAVYIAVIWAYAWISMRRFRAVTQNRADELRKRNEVYSEGWKNGLAEGKAEPNGKPVWNVLPEGNEPYVLKAQFPYNGNQYCVFVGQTSGAETFHRWPMNSTKFVPETKVQTHAVYTVVNVRTRSATTQSRNAHLSREQRIWVSSMRLLVRSDDPRIDEGCYTLPELYFVDDVRVDAGYWQGVEQSLKDEAAAVQ